MNIIATTTMDTTLIGKPVLHGSPGYQTPEVIAEITPKGHDFEMVFESQCFSTLSLDELYELQDDGEVSFREKTHGGLTVITLA
jgi:hypothetical protein